MANLLTLDPTLWVDRLDELKTSNDLMSVAVYAESNPDKLEALNYPAVWFIPRRERRQGQKGRTNKYACFMGCMIAYRSPLGRFDEELVTKLLQTRSLIYQRIAGWTPTGCSDFVTLADGDFVEIDDNGVAWWFDIWETARIETFR